MMTAYSCPYCHGELSSPTRKKKCSHCGKTVYVRTPYGQKQNWVRLEDLSVIEAEWVAKKSEELKKSREAGNKIQRENVRLWFTTGVKSIKVYSGEDDKVCNACRAVHGKIFPISTAREVEEIVENIPIHECNNPEGCRCYWRPENIF